MPTPRSTTLKHRVLYQGAAAAAILAAVAAVAAVSAQEPPTATPTCWSRRRASARPTWQRRRSGRNGNSRPPKALVEGPPGNPGGSRAQVNPPDGVPCTYEAGAAGMGGKTRSSYAARADGRSIRVKYFSGDPVKGNREVFAEVVATRLFWALGFPTDRSTRSRSTARTARPTRLHGTAPGPRAGTSASPSLISRGR